MVECWGVGMARRRGDGTTEANTMSRCTKTERGGRIFASGSLSHLTVHLLKPIYLNFDAYPFLKNYLFTHTYSQESYVVERNYVHSPGTIPHQVSTRDPRQRSTPFSDVKAHQAADTDVRNQVWRYYFVALVVHGASATALSI